MGYSMNDKDLERLYTALLTLGTQEECRAFLEDILSMDEILDISRRLKAAQMLRRGAVYSEITAETGLSTATISRVNRALKYGNDGYSMVLDRMEAGEESDT